MSIILLPKARSSTWRQAAKVLEHHTRQPDVAMSMTVLIPLAAETQLATEQRATEQRATAQHSKSRQLATEQRASRTYIAYDAEYKGHGGTKTAFVLIAPGEPLHDMILKLTAKRDPEPDVFKAMPDDVTPRILYECNGFHGDTRYHCWITERTIPLDEFARDPAADKQQCTLGAFICVLRAAMLGLRLSDSAFFNFGVRCSDSVVVIIDAGSWGIDRNQQWSKGDVNLMIMRQFWKNADKAKAANPELRQLWEDHWQLKPCLYDALALWARQPHLQHATQSMQDTAALLAVNEERAFIESQDTGACKLVALVGRHQCNGEWNFVHTRALWRAAVRFNKQLGQSQLDIVDELYSRLTRYKNKDYDACDATKHAEYVNRSKEEVRNILDFWEQLRDIRNECPNPETIVEDGVWYCWYDIFWDELKEEQRWRTDYHSFRNAMLNKRAGWTYAAKAILKDGLPRLEANYGGDDPPKRIRAIGQFAEEMAEWLHNFSNSMVVLRQSDRYRKAYQASMQPSRAAKRAR